MMTEENDTNVGGAGVPRDEVRLVVLTARDVAMGKMMNPATTMLTIGDTRRQDEVGGGGLEGLIETTAVGTVVRMSPLMILRAVTRAVPVSPVATTAAAMKTAEVLLARIQNQNGRGADMDGEADGNTANHGRSGRA